MAVIGIGVENSNDEVTQYQMGRYFSSNKTVWRIFSFLFMRDTLLLFT